MGGRRELAPGWFPVMVALQAAALMCLWALQRLSTARSKGGDGDVAARRQRALQGRARRRRDRRSAPIPDARAGGVERARAVAGLTAANLLTFAAVLAMPVLAVPALVRGSVPAPCSRRCWPGGRVRVLFALGAVLLALDGALEWVGRTVQQPATACAAGPRRSTGLPQRLVRERTGSSARRPEVEASAGRDRRALGVRLRVAARRAARRRGDRARPGLVLLAFCTAQVLAQIPAGLGFVEAGLTATLVLAGVGGGAAVLATFAYRLVSYWLPLPFGLVGATAPPAALRQSTTMRPMTLRPDGTPRARSFFVRLIPGGNLAGSLYGTVLVTSVLAAFDGLRGRSGT